MKNRIAAPIALFDSGVGGIGVLREVKKLLPREQLIFFGDAANAPYGERPAEEILRLTLIAAERLIAHAKALVLACNTATAVAAAELRRRYPDHPVIGMEPALCPALSVGAHPTVLVLATEATLRQEKFAQLRQKCERSATVRALSAPGIVRLVEAGLADSPQMDAYLRSLLAPLPKRPDAVVLGCTHFPFARAALQRVLGNVPLFDGAAGTAKELHRRLAARGLLSAASEGGILLHTSNPASLPLMARLLEMN
jgi:glutamate racemase